MRAALGCIVICWKSISSRQYVEVILQLNAPAGLPSEKLSPVLIG